MYVDQQWAMVFTQIIHTLNDPNSLIFQMGKVTIKRGVSFLLKLYIAVSVHFTHKHVNNLSQKNENENVLFFLMDSQLNWQMKHG